MYDLIIRNGNIIDGTGSAPVVGDIAVKQGLIHAIMPRIDADAVEIIDASGKLVTPGFIDIHTHYDGQVTWDQELLPSAAHGATTVIMGCCGIGFAPVRQGSEDWLITLTEGVEDIPGTALHVGIPWGWESFPEYLDFIGTREYALDIAAHVPHSALRAYVLGEKALDDGPATPEDLSRMAKIVRESIRAGAVGFATSRVSLHRGSDGSVLPGTTAAEGELLALAEAVRDGGGGVLQFIPSGISGGVEGEEGEHMLAGARPDKFKLTAEIEMFRRLHRRSGQPVTFLFAESPALGDEEYEKARAIVSDIARKGERIFPQFSPRACGGLLSLDTYHPFMGRPTYSALAHLSVPERAERMADPAVKAAILAERDSQSDSSDPFARLYETFQRNFHAIFSLESLNYEPSASDSVKAMADASGREPMDLCYDLLLQREGTAVLIWFSTGYLDGDLRKKGECLADPQYIMGIGDAGAHVQFICDASFTTFLLAHWGKNRTKGPRFPIEYLVKKITKDAAELYGMNDRGAIEVGRRADLNVIDFDRLALEHPRMAADLPSGCKRFLQGAVGYDMTIVKGVVVRRNDQDTGARPGRLVRNRGAVPAALPSHTN